MARRCRLTPTLHWHHPGHNPYRHTRRTRTYHLPTTQPAAGGACDNEQRPRPRNMPKTAMQLRPKHTPVLLPAINYRRHIIGASSGKVRTFWKPRQTALWGVPYSPSCADCLHTVRSAAHLHPFTIFHPHQIQCQRVTQPACTHMVQVTVARPNIARRPVGEERCAQRIPAAACCPIVRARGSGMHRGSSGNAPHIK